MISDAINLVGAAGSGAVLGLIGNLISSGVEKKKLELERERERTQQQIDAINQNKGSFKVDEGGELEDVSYFWGLYRRTGKTRDRAINPPFYFAILCITWTYCAATITCFLLGDIVVATQNPTAEPTTTSWAWGFFEHSVQNSTIAVVTFASVGSYMAHFLAFVLSAVLTGIVPKKL